MYHIIKTIFFIVFILFLLYHLFLLFIIIILLLKYFALVLTFGGKLERGGTWT